MDTTITNPFASHLTRYQHNRLARHYRQRHLAMLATKRATLAQHCDCVAMFHKWLYHKRAGETLATIEAQQQTAAALIALSLGAV